MLRKKKINIRVKIKKNENENNTKNDWIKQLFFKINKQHGQTPFELAKSNNEIRGKKRYITADTKNIQIAIKN